jgi:heat shock protein HslJ
MLAASLEPYCPAGRQAAVIKPFLLLFVALLVSACSAVGAPSSPTPSPKASPPATPGPTPTNGSPSADPIALAGRTFLSVSVTKAGVERPLVPGTRISLTFGTDRRLSASAGCNTLGASYRVEGGILVVSDAAQTAMGCAQPAQAQDDWVFAFLTSGPVPILNGNELTLTQGDLVGQFLDREVADPDRPLTGTTWVVTTVLSRDVASSIPAGVRATLQFGKDGRVAVSTSCNSGGGTWTLDGKNISFGPIALTKMACGRASMDMERAVVATLAADHLTYRIEATSLWLESADVGLGLTAKQ